MKRNNFVKTRSERLFELLEFSGAFFLGLSLFLPIFAAAGQTAFIAIAAAVFLAAMSAGYFLQSAFCALINTSRGESTVGYEQTSKLYDFRYAIPVYIAAAAAAAAVSGGVDLILRKIGEMPGNFYDTESALPILLGALTAVCVIYGSFVWFFPYDRFLTGRAMAYGLVAILISFCLYVVLAKLPVSGVIALCLAGYSSCAFIAMNQVTISKSYGGTIVAFVNDESRLFNLRSTGAVIAAGGVFTLIGYTLLSGLRTLGRMILSLIVKPGTNNETWMLGDDEKERIREETNRFIFGEGNPAESSDFWFFILFLVLSIAGIVFVLFLFRLSWSAVLEKIRDWFDALIRLFGFKKTKKVNKPVKTDYTENFVDEETLLPDRWARRSSVRKTWHDFRESLEGRSVEERFVIAYGEFVRECRESDPLMKASMTPREMAKPLEPAAKTVDADIGKITGEYEKIRFGGRSATDETAGNTDRLCAFVRRNIE